MTLEQYKKEDMKLLYIDDEPRNLELFSIAFKREYTIFSCPSAEEAFNILKEQGEFPVIITDQRMPDMQGIEFLKRIMLNHMDTIRIILTCHTDVEFLIEAINMAKVYRYVVKPWSKEELSLAIKGAFSRYFLAKENKMLIDQLKIKNLKLTQTIDELKHAQAQIVRQEQKAVVGTLARGFSHKINSLLNPIALLENIKDEASEKDQKNIQLIYDGRDQIAALIGEINAIANNELVNFLIDEHNLKELVDYAINLAKLDLDVKYKKIVTEHGYEGRIMADKRKLTLVLINLIRNAAQAIGNSNKGKILIKSEKQNGHARISVIDNGCGIEKDKIDKIWELFYSSKGEKGGGIGLDICKHIIKGHNGEITCDSERNRGAIFTFSIPL